jgi:hypothetical protein
MYSGYWAYGGVKPELVPYWIADCVFIDVHGIIKETFQAQQNV